MRSFGIETLAAAVVSLILVCQLTGQTSFLSKVGEVLRREAEEALRADWGCPSAFSAGACRGYDPDRYREGVPSQRNLTKKGSEL